MDSIEAMVEEFSELPRSEVETMLAHLEADMAQASIDMDYERAAQLRDQIVRIRSQLEGTTSDDVIKRLKAGARRGSAHATRRRYRKKH